MYGLLTAYLAGIVSAYLFTHPSERAVLFGRVATFLRDEFAWLKSISFKR